MLWYFVVGDNSIFPYITSVGIDSLLMIVSGRKTANVAIPTPNLAIP